jgi:hypothetical protein
MDEAARQRARELVNTEEFATAQRQRKKVEALFAELKNQIGLRRLRLRRLKFVREQFFPAAARAEPQTRRAIPQLPVNPADCNCMNLTRNKDANQDPTGQKASCEPSFFNTTPDFTHHASASGTVAKVGLLGNVGFMKRS